MRSRRFVSSFAVLMSSALAACQPAFNQPDPAATVDEPYFRCQVQPILTMTCGMFACHGADGTKGTTMRYFRLYGRNRLRDPAIPEAMRGSQLLPTERQANFVAARALIDTDNPDQSFLLLKPLDQLAGGYFHRGAEIFGGGDVFASVEDSDYKRLQAWVHGAKDDPQCIEPGSNQ